MASGASTVTHLAKYKLVCTTPLLVYQLPFEAACTWRRVRAPPGAHLVSMSVLAQPNQPCLYLPYASEEVRFAEASTWVTSRSTEKIKRCVFIITHLSAAARDLFVWFEHATVLGSDGLGLQTLAV